MTIRSDVSINWDVSPRIITVASPSVKITMQDLHDTCRSLEAENVAMDNPPLIDSAGLEDLGEGDKVGLTSTLQNALLAFEARPGPTYVQCLATGGNLVAVNDVGTTLTTPISPTAFTQVVYARSSSPTLQITAAGLTEQDKIDIANQNWAQVLEGTMTAEEMMKIMAAVLWGKASGMENNSPVFRSIMDTKDRVTATTDQHGNRTSTSMDGT